MLSYIVTASTNELKNLKRLMHASLRTNRKGGEAKETVPWGQEQGYTLLKNFELGNLWWRMYVYYVVMSICALAFVSFLKPGQALASLRGLADMIVNFKEIWQKRVKIQSSRRVSDKELFLRKLLRKDVWATLSYLRNVAPVAIV